MVGRAARQCLYDFLAYLAKSDDLSATTDVSHLGSRVVAVAQGRQALMDLVGRAVVLLGKNTTSAGQGSRDNTEARLASLAPLNRLAARLEAALTGLELGDWFCLGLGYGRLPMYQAFCLFLDSHSVLESN